MKNAFKSLIGTRAFRSNVARRIFLLFILCALIPLSVLAYFSFSQVTKNLYAQADEDLHHASKASGMATFESLRVLETDLDMLGALLEQGKNGPAALPVPRLRERLVAGFKGIALTTGNGRTKSLLGEMPALPRLTAHERDHVLAGKTLILTRPAAQRRAALYMVKAVFFPQAPPDLVFGEIDPAYLWGSEDLSLQTELFVLDQSDNVLFSSFPQYLPLQELKSAREKNPSIGRFTWTYGGESFLAGYWNLFMVPRFDASWILVQGQAKTDILAPIGNFKIVFLSLVLLTFLIAVLLSLIQIRRSLVPIEQLREATRMIAAKKFDSRVAIDTGDEFEELGKSFNAMAAGLENNLQIMTTMNNIGLALSAEKDNKLLLDLILLGAKTITHADGCALYTVTKDKQLRLSVMHVDSINVALDDAAGDVVVPLYDADGKPDTRTALALSELRDVAVNIPDIDRSQEFDFSHIRDLDKRIGYRSRSLLCVPVKDYEGETVGVFLLINAVDRTSQSFVPFTGEDQRLLETLASQAAVALSKNKLIEDFSALFDSLVELIATAIDKKSPYTGNHCRRVPELTMMLAEAVSGGKEGVFGDLTLSKEEFHELKIAALLHDCGKVTTPVHISDKATRLETIFDRIHLIDARFEIVKRDAEIAFMQKRQEALSSGSDRALPAEREAFGKILEQIEQDRQFVRTCNSGATMMDEQRKKRMERIARDYRWTDGDGNEQPLLSAGDRYMLTSATSGTLTPEERAVINQHVETTIKMLESLHYPKSLRNVPIYAQSHHERMDGKGYPKGLTKKDIPLQGRIIAIADIFEAMTAQDRPYKRGKTLMEALRELGAMKEEGHIDPDLFNVFITEKVYLRYAEKFLSPAQIDEIDFALIPGYVPPSQQ